MRTQIPEVKIGSKIVSLLPLRTTIKLEKNNHGEAYETEEGFTPTRCKEMIEFCPDLSEENDHLDPSIIAKYNEERLSVGLIREVQRQLGNHEGNKRFWCTVMGSPGSGKSVSTKYLVKHMKDMADGISWEMKILVVSKTNNAVFELKEKIAEDFEEYRITHPISNDMSSKLQNEEDGKNALQLIGVVDPSRDDNNIEGASIFFSTFDTLASQIIPRGAFSLIIVEEASTVHCVKILSEFMTKNCLTILTGDVKQLPDYENRVRREKQAKIAFSFFEENAQTGKYISLNLARRSAPEIYMQVKAIYGSAVKFLSNWTTALRDPIVHYEILKTEGQIVPSVRDLFFTSELQGWLGNILQYSGTGEDGSIAILCATNKRAMEWRIFKIENKENLALKKITTITTIDRSQGDTYFYTILDNSGYNVRTIELSPGRALVAHSRARKGIFNFHNGDKISLFLANQDYERTTELILWLQAYHGYALLQDQI